MRYLCIMNMNRRHFCKIAALAAGAVGINGIEASATTSRSGRRLDRGCPVTVIRRECYEDLQSLYLDDPETGRCEAFSTGDIHTFIPGDTCPQGFCPQAFEAIRRLIAGEASCPGAETTGGVMLLSCPDGTRPVIFKVEPLRQL